MRLRFPACIGPVVAPSLPSLRFFLGWSEIEHAKGCAQWSSLHERREKRALGVGHGLDVRVGHRVELLVLELVVRPDVDVSTPVLGRVAVFGRGED